MPLREDLVNRIVGQTDAIDAIVPFIQMHQAGLSPEGRPLGVIMLLGPTGTGKTRTVEALAEVLHGSSKNLLKVDCGEFQMEHEIAKLIGAPPGYLGHRETQPRLTQAKLNTIASDGCAISLVLFDEIEKASESLNRILLGILDKAALSLGDNSTVNFESALIFLTSNLGTKEISSGNRQPGFERPVLTATDRAKQNHAVTMASVRRKFSPEFCNRIDSFVTYRRLTRDDARQILNIELAALSRLLQTRLAIRKPNLQIAESACEFLLERGFSEEYGARELKRAIHRHLLTPLAERLSSGLIPSASWVWVEAGTHELTFTLERAAAAG